MLKVENLRLGFTSGKTTLVAVDGISFAIAKGETFALLGESGDLGEHVVEGARNFITSGKRHDAVSAELAASFHDRHEGGRTVDPGQRQMVEFLDFRE